MTPETSTQPRIDEIDEWSLGERPPLTQDDLSLSSPDPLERHLRRRRYDLRTASLGQ